MKNGGTEPDTTLGADEAVDGLQADTLAPFGQKKRHPCKEGPQRLKAIGHVRVIS